MRRNRKSFLAVGMCLAGYMGAAPAAAQAFANEMTCSEAIAHFERTGTIFVMANDRFAVPLRGATPANQVAQMQCPGRGQQPRPERVATRDDARCVIGFRC